MGFQNNSYSSGTRNNAFHNGQKRDSYSGSQPSRSFAPEEPVKPMSIPADYLDQAEELMRENTRLITTSKIRRLFSMVTEIYNEENLSTRKELAEDSVAAIGMMRIRFAYECGREKNVKTFVQQAHLMNYLKGIGNSREEFIKFARYMEALMAYHRFFGGREN